MTSEKWKNALGCPNLDKDLLFFFFLQFVTDLHFEHLIVYYVPNVGNIKTIMTSKS